MPIERFATCMLVDVAHDTIRRNEHKVIDGYPETRMS